MHAVASYPLCLQVTLLVHQTGQMLPALPFHLTSPRYAVSDSMWLLQKLTSSILSVLLLPRLSPSSPLVSTPASAESASL